MSRFSRGCHVRFCFNETVLTTSRRVISYCFLKEKNLCLGTSYKTKNDFIRSIYYYCCEKPVCLRCRITQFARARVRLCPFHGLHVSQLELSDRNLLNRIIKITHAHSSHVKMLDFGPFRIRT